MASFESVLNAVIPWVVAIIGIYILYRPLQEPLAPLFNGIARFFGAIKRKISGEDVEEDFFKPMDNLEYE